MLNYLRKMKKANIVTVFMLVLSMIAPFVPAMSVNADDTPPAPTNVFRIEIQNVTGYTTEGQDDFVNLSNGMSVRFTYNGSPFSLVVDSTNNKAYVDVTNEAAKQIYVDVNPNGKNFKVRVGGSELSANADNKYILDVAQGTTAPLIIDVEEVQNNPGGDGGQNPPGDGGQNNPPYVPSVITIGGTTVVDENTANPVIDNSGYNVYFNENEGCYVIEIGKNGNAVLDPIASTGSADIAIRLIDGNNIEDPTEFNIVADQAQPYAISIGGTLYINGDWDTRLVVEGGIKANKIWIRDIEKFDLNSGENGGLGIDANGGDIIFDKTTATIIPFNNPAFSNASTVRANSGCKVDVWGGCEAGHEYQELYNVGSIQVYEGGRLNINAFDGSTINNTIPAFAYKLNDVGEILDVTEGVDDHGREIECQLGDYSATDRYIYSREGSNLTLESTTASLSSLSFQFTDPTEDNYVENGDFIVEASSGIRRWNKEHTEYDYMFENGCEVKFTLVPKAGYQYVPDTFAFEGGDGTGEATADPGVYIYHMGNRPVHVRCKFAKTDDSVVVETKSVKKANITVPEGIITNGTAELGIKDATLSDSQKSNFDKAAGSMVVGQALDLSFGQKIDKIDADGSWNTPIKELDKPMTIAIELDSDTYYDSYEVIREHDGKTEVVAAKFDPETRTLTFDTDKYSTYAIAHSTKVISVGNKTNNNTNSNSASNNASNTGVRTVDAVPTTGDTNPYPFIGLVMLASLMGAVICFRKRTDK